MTRLFSSIHSTPVGTAYAVTADDRLVALRLASGDGVDAEREQLVRLLHATPAPDQASGAQVGAELDEYFAGTRQTFDVPLDWRLTTGFVRTALEAVREIPYGETASYGEIAARAGSARAARAVGTACATTPISLIVPVHRVVRADGSIGEYGGHPEVKEYLLTFESGGSEADE